MFFSLQGLSQNPDFVANVKKQDTLHSEKLIDIVKNYEFSIAYTADSYWWAEKKDFYILAFSNKKWTLITYKKHYYKDTAYLYDTTKMPDVTVSKRKVSRRQVNKLFTILNNERFWTLDTDSLNITSRKLTDSTSIKMDITDGVNYKFEIVANSRMRIVQAYEPYEYLKHFPEIIIRQNFINCLEAFEKLKKKYRS